jgi:MFS family permease
MAPRDAAAASDSGAGPAGAGGERPARVGALAPFRHSFFRAIWTTNLVSNFGTWFQSVGAAWAMTLLAPSADMIALVQAASSLPILLFSIWAGAVADMWNRRFILIASLVVMFAAAVTVATLSYMGAITPWVLLAVTFAIGTGNALYSPAWQASVGEMVPREEVPAAVALNSVNFNMTRAVGPALGGMVVASAGITVAFAINAFTYLPVIAAYALWGYKPARSRLPRERLLSAVAAGLRYVGQAPEIQTVLARSLCFGFSASAIMALAPVVARVDLGGDALTYGLMLCSMGVGAIAGAAVLPTLRRRIGAEGLATAGGIGVTMACFGLGSGVVVLAFAAMFIAGTIWLCTLSTFNTSVQLSSPNWVKARALAIYQTVVFGGMAAGAWVWGQVAEARTTSVALWAAGTVMLVGLLLRHRYPLAEPDRMDLRPHTDWSEPKVATEFDHFDTPVKITVEYIVAAEKAEDFTHAMRELQRIRKRNGAARWRLWHDVERPERWLESFEAPSWIDHMRLYDRSTIADRAVLAHARSFHVGPEPPKAQRFALALHRTHGDAHHP